jgi:hypothetical protein
MQPQGRIMGGGEPTIKFGMRYQDVKSSRKK